MIDEGRLDVSQIEGQGERYITAREVGRAGRAVAGDDPALLPRGADPGPAAAGQIRPVRFLWSEVEAVWDGIADRRLRTRAGVADGWGTRRERAARTVVPRAGGLWAIRYYDARGQRRQRNGLPHAREAREALEEALRRVRLGPLFSRG